MLDINLKGQVGNMDQVTNKGNKRYSINSITEVELGRRHCENGE